MIELENYDREKKLTQSIEFELKKIKLEERERKKMERKSREREIVC